MGRWVAIAAAFCLLGAAPREADPDDAPDIEVQGTEPVAEYYEVRGTSLAALFSEVETRGPEGKTAKARLGLRYEIMPRLDAKGACEVGTVRIVAETRMLLPAWADKDNANRDLRERWACLYEALERHERGHARIHAENAQSVGRVLKETPAQPTCPELSREVSRRFEGAKKSALEKQQAYDRETGQGRKQFNACL